MLRHRCFGALVLCGLAAVGPARAQLGRWWVGGGLVAPGGEYSTHDKAGWHLLAAFSPLGSARGALGLRIDALYGRTPRKISLQTNSQVFGLGAAVMVHPVGPAGVHPYALAGIGYYELEEGASGGVSSAPVNGIALLGGAGMAIHAGRTRAFIEARFIGGPVKNGVSFIPVTLGLSF
jgi:hypothetical protein